MSMIDLTAATLSELVASLRSTLASGMEKRRLPRVGMRLRAHIALSRTDRTDTVQIWVRNVSANGFGFTCTQEMQAGEMFTLLLAGDRPESVACQVRHCRRVASGVFQLGAKFIDALPARRRTH
jgi:hypothetical protein